MTTTSDEREETCYGQERRDRQEEKRTWKGEGGGYDSVPQDGPQ